MDIAITKMSSKGQVVIPSEMRSEIEEGEKLIIIQNEDQLILKKATDFEHDIIDDLEFAKQTEEAWRRYDAGEFISMDGEDFLEEIKKW